MRYVYLILCTSFVISFLEIGIYHYNTNVNVIHGQARSAFVHTLKQKFKKKNYGIFEVPYNSFSEEKDTVPFTVDSSLVLDSLRQSWKDMLCYSGMHVTTAIQIFVTGQNGKLTHMKSGMDQESFFDQCTFISYISNYGYEVEVVGYIGYTWWTVFMYDWTSFFWNIIVIILIFSLLLYCLQLRQRSHKAESVEKKVPYEVIGSVKEVDEIKPEIYRLNDELIFNPRQQLLIHLGNEIKLSPQSTAILKFFLDASEYTVTDDELVKNIWGMNKGASIKNFRSASQRLYNVFNRVGCSIKFMRVGIDKYALVFIDNQ